jgi:hypothetical protein
MFKVASSSLARFVYHRFLPEGTMERMEEMEVAKEMARFLPSLVDPEFF